MSPQYRRRVDQMTMGDVVLVLFAVGGMVAAGYVIHGALHELPMNESLIGKAFLGGLFCAALIRPDPIFDRLKRVASLGSRFFGRKGRDSGEHSREDHIK